jgi:hypothetical protein
VLGRCSSRESNPERFGFADLAIIRMKGASRRERVTTVRLVELAEQRAKARASHAANEHAATAAVSRQAPGAPNGGMAVHVGENHDDVRAIDESSKRLASATVHVPGVAFELVATRLRHRRWLPRSSIPVGITLVRLLDRASSSAAKLRPVS